MKVLLCHEYGAPESLRLEETDPPALPSPTSVRIAVGGVALTFPDLLTIEGKYQHRAPFPFAPGMECAGRVAEVGPAMTALAVGDRVAAHPGSTAWPSRWWPRRPRSSACPTPWTTTPLPPSPSPAAPSGMRWWTGARSRRAKRS